MATHHRGNAISVPVDRADRAASLPPRLIRPRRRFGVPRHVLTILAGGGSLPFTYVPLLFSPAAHAGQILRGNLYS